MASVLRLTEIEAEELGKDNYSEGKADPDRDP